MSEKAAASYDDLRKLPDNVTGMIIEGALYAMPRSGNAHGMAASALISELRSRFGRRNNEWSLCVEPELHLGDDVLVPDVAAWRRERLPKPPAEAFFSLAPDWVCEVLSPSTFRFDRMVKMSSYARHGIAFLWLVDPVAQLIEAYRLEQQRWLLTQTCGGDDTVYLEPFEAAPLELSELWLPE